MLSLPPTGSARVNWSDGEVSLDAVRNACSMRSGMTYSAGSVRPHSMGPKRLLDAVGNDLLDAVGDRPDEHLGFGRGVVDADEGDAKMLGDIAGQRGGSTESDNDRYASPDAMGDG